MAEPFQLIGAVAVNVLAQIPLNPQLTFRHISPHMVHLLARMMAKRAVQEQLRSEGVRVSLVKPAEISARAQVYLQSHPEVWREALERAHLFDEAEGQRKARQKLRRAELARRRLQPLMITPDRPVCRTENAKSATDNSRIICTTKRRLVVVEC